MRKCEIEFQIEFIGPEYERFYSEIEELVNLMIVAILKSTRGYWDLRNGIVVIIVVSLINDVAPPYIAGRYLFYRVYCGSGRQVTCVNFFRPMAKCAIAEHRSNGNGDI